MWSTVAPLPVVPSPKSQAYDATVPSESVDGEPSKWQTSLAQEIEAAATGGSFSGLRPASRTNMALEAQFWSSTPGPDTCTLVPPTGPEPDQSARNSCPVEVA